MKNLLTALLPALTLFALGGCAGTSALTSSEDDGVYYSSRDRTTAAVPTAAAPTAAVPVSVDEAANPDYNGNPARSSARQGSGSTEYYDNSYTYMRGVPNYGVTSYVPYSPYTAISYGAFGGYGGGGGAYGFSPNAFYGGFSDPFYSPFYSPYYGYGSGINISFGFGQPYGFGGYGRPFGFGGYGGGFGGYGGGFGGYGRGFGGFGGGFGGFGGGFYDPYYGRGGYYGNNYYGGGYHNNGGGYNNNNNGNNNNGRTSGRRSDPASDGRYSTGGVGTPPANSGGSRMRTDGLAAPGPDLLPVSGLSPNDNGRVRSDATTTSPNNLQPARAEESYNRSRRMERADQPQYRNMGDPATSGQGQTPAAEQPVRQEGQRRRGGFFQDVFTQPSNNGGQTSDQQPRQRSYEQPRQRSYSQPQRSYEQPQQRSYSQPSYSSPSNGGGGGGGGRGRGRGE